VHVGTLLRTTPSLSESAIQNKIELEIRRSTSLRINPASTTVLHAIMSVNDLNSDDYRSPIYYCMVKLLLEEPVRILRSGSLESTISWHTGESHSWSSEDSTVTKLPSRLEIFLNKFLNA